MIFKWKFKEIEEIFQYLLLLKFYTHWFQHLHFL